MRPLFLLLFLSLTLANLSGCGNPPKASQLANQQSLDDFARLIGDHPELGAASLKEIKTSAEQRSKNTPSDLNFALEPASPENSGAIKPELAQKAQSLIDDILDNFDFATQLSAAFKFTGIFLNMQKERLKQFEAYAKSFGDKHDGQFSKFDVGSTPKDMTCEAFMDNPFTKIPKEKYDLLALQNRELIKKTISGCPKLVAQKFIQCISDFNVIVSLIDQHATCDLKSIDELEQLLERKADGQYQEKSKAVKECLSVDFSSCGFELQQVSQN